MFKGVQVLDDHVDLCIMHAKGIELQSFHVTNNVKLKSHGGAPLGPLIGVSARVTSCTRYI